MRVGDGTPSNLGLLFGRQIPGCGHPEVPKLPPGLVRTVTAFGLHDRVMFSDNAAIVAVERR